METYSDGSTSAVSSLWYGIVLSASSTLLVSWGDKNGEPAGAGYSAAVCLSLFEDPSCSTPALDSSGGDIYQMAGTYPNSPERDPRAGGLLPEHRIDRWLDWRAASASALEIEKMLSYACYGLGIRSELPLPLPECSSTTGALAISVGLGGFEPLDAECMLPYDAGGALYGPYDGAILIRVKGVADFLVSDSSISVGQSGRSVEELGDLVVRLALGFVLQQRSMLVFHGAAASRDGRAVAILGERGAGKSTTAMGLAKRGWGLLCDDIVVVEPGGTTPRGASRVRLNADSYDRLMDGRRASAAPLDRDGKHPVESGGEVRAAPLRKVFIIESAEVEGVQVHEARGYAKLELALGHMHSPSGIGDPGDRLRRAAEAIARVPLYAVRRPSQRFALDELLDIIETISLKDAE